MNNDNIDFLSLIKQVWSKKFFVASITFFFILIGVVSALTAKIIFTSSTTFIPQSQENISSSGLGGVASLVGINLGGLNSNAEIPYTIYPEVIESINFKSLLLREVIDSNDKLTLQEFLIKEYNIDKEKFTKSENPLTISRGDFELYQILNDVVLIEVNKQDGFVTLKTNLSNNEYAANTCVKARSILQDIIIQTKIKSAEQNLKYSQNQLNKKRVEFEKIQNELAYFNDSNLNLVTSAVKNKRDKLEADFQIINAVIIELSKQVEQNKLQVSKNTPVFSVIKEASVPVIRTYPKRTQMVLIFGFIGLVISISYVILKNPIINFLGEIN